MPTDDTSTQVTDASAHQSQTDSKTDSVADTGQTFDARKAFDNSNKRFNDFQKDVSAKLEKIDPDVITQIAEKLGVTKKEAEQKVEDKTPDAQVIVQEEFWKRDNAERLEDETVSKSFESYVKLGYQRDHALRLAEQDAGIQVDNSQQKRQQKNSTADASVDRSGPAGGPYQAGQFGITEEDVQKYGAQAAGVKIHR